MRARLQKRTDLKRKLKTKTWWKSTFKMLERRVQLRPFVAEIADEFLGDFLLSPATEQRVDILQTKLGELNDVVTKFQTNDCTARIAQAYFDLVLEAQPILEARMDGDARIVQTSFFEAEIVELQDQKESRLSAAERRTLSPLLVKQISTARSEYQSELISESA